jgi:hypothetical protein
MKIHRLLSDGNDDSYYSHEFKVLIESHLNYLKANDARIVDVSEHQNYKWEGDFYGLLDDFNISKDYHYPIMRMNGITNSAHYKGDLKMIVIPDYNVIERLKTILQTKNS